MIGCRPLTPAEVSAVSKAFDGPYEARDRALFWLGLTTGFRISELLSLRVGDIWRGGRLLPRVKVQRRHTKGRRRPSSSPLAPAAKPHLRAWLLELFRRRGDSPSTPLFPSRRRAPRPLSRSQAHRLLTAAFARAGLIGGPGELATHSLRKTFAARHHAHFGDIFAVQKALRHLSPSSTVAYLSFDDQALVQAAATIWRDQDPAADQPKEDPPNVVRFQAS